MGWYDNKTDGLDFDLPIVARSAGEEYLLMPQLKKGNYNPIGYNWFNVRTGKYNSCCMFTTAQEAVKSYREMRYRISNTRVELE